MFVPDRLQLFTKNNELRAQLPHSAPYVLKEDSPCVVFSNYVHYLLKIRKNIVERK